MGRFTRYAFYLLCGFALGATLAASPALAAPYIVPVGGTGASSFSPNLLLVGGGTNPLTSTSSPTVGIITSTSTLLKNILPNVFSTHSTTSDLTITGTLSKILLTDGNGLASGYSGTSCTNQFVRSLSALGVATCNSVANTDLANSSFSTSLSGITGSATVALGGTLSLTAGVATGTVPTQGQLAYWGAIGTPSRLLSVATSSETCTAPLSCAVHVVLAGGGAISLSQATINADGYLSATNFQTFNNKIGTSSSATRSQVAYFTTTSGTPALLSGVSTSSVSCTSPLSCTAFDVLGSNGGALTLSNLTVANGGTGATTFGQGWIFSNGGTGALAASTSPTVNYITATSTTATSTFANGIEITKGCFKINGACLTAGAGGGIANLGPLGQLQNGTTITLATTTTVFNGLTFADIITATGNTINFDPSIAGTLTVGGGGTGLSTFATGDLLYASGANTLAARAAGTNGQILGMSGGVPTWISTSTMPAAMETIASGSFSAANTQQWTSISPAYRYLILKINGLSSNTATRLPALQISTNNGSSYVATGYKTVIGDGANTSDIYINSPPADVAAATSYSAVIKFYGYQDASTVSADGYWQDSAGSEFASSHGFYLAGSGAVNAIRMIWDGTGNSDAGTYVLYGMR